MLKVNLKENRVYKKKSRVNPLMENIISEGGEDFVSYLNFLGLAMEPEMMVLSSMQHYYYDHNDLMGIKVLVNLKKLNRIRHLESFLHTLYRILPSKAYFIGYFNNNSHIGNSLSTKRTSSIFGGFIHLLDSGNERIMSEKKTKSLLEENGFTVFDMTEINGVTYFWAQNNRRPGE
jgi:hypothetical protein